MRHVVKAEGPATIVVEPTQSAVRLTLELRGPTRDMLFHHEMTKDSLFLLISPVTAAELAVALLRAGIKSGGHPSKPDP